jgi:hypothetical protein
VWITRTLGPQSGRNFSPALSICTSPVNFHVKWARGWICQFRSCMKSFLLRINPSTRTVRTSQRHCFTANSNDVHNQQEIKCAVDVLWWNYWGDIPWSKYRNGRVKISSSTTFYDSSHDEYHAFDTLLCRLLQVHGLERPASKKNPTSSNVFESGNSSSPETPNAMCFRECPTTGPQLGLERHNGTPWV